MILRFLLSGLFEVRVAEYLDSCPEPEPSGVNRFLKGLGRRRSTDAVEKSERFFWFAFVFFCSGNKMKLLQIKWLNEYSGFELRDFILTTCCCGRARIVISIVIVKSSDKRKPGSSDIISEGVHAWELHAFYWTQTGNNDFDWGHTRIAFQMYNLS